MPRKYLKKRADPNYTIDDIQKAVLDVQNHLKTFRQAADAYGVPVAVIFHWIKGRKVDINRMGAGVSPTLSQKDELHIADCLQKRGLRGYPVSKAELKKLVGEYTVAAGIKNNFKNNIPGEHWYQNFKRRHPELSLKKPEHLQKSRMAARKPYIIYDFYDMLARITKENNLEDKPWLIFNADESGFSSDPSRVRAIGKKGIALSRVSGGSGKESTSTLACVSASGSYLPPLIVFKGLAVQPRWVSENVMPGTRFSATVNGWMEEPVFYDWLKNSFFPFVDQLRVNDPNQKALLIYDGHTSHISLRIIDEAEKHNVILLRFPSHLTDRIQPLDKCVFGPIKKEWDAALVRHGIEQMGNGEARVKKHQFAEILSKVWENALRKENIIAGFQTTGIHPLNASKFPVSFFDPKEYEVYKTITSVSASNYDHERQQSTLATPSTENNGLLSSTSLTTVVPFVETPVEDPMANDLVDIAIPSTSSNDFENIIIASKISTTMTHKVVNDNDQEAEKVTLDMHNSSHLNTPSSSLINNIFKMISLDQTTNGQTKSNIIAAITKLFEDNRDPKTPQKISPSKDKFQLLFGIEKTPTKKEKIVVPRLKASAYGEVLTTPEVKERLKLAEEKKRDKNLKKRPLKTINQDKDKPAKKKQRFPKSAAEIPYAESDSDYNIEDEYQHDIEYVEMRIVEHVQKGNFILVKFKGGKRLTTEYRYVCIVDAIDEEDGEIKIVSLKCVNKTKTTFSIQEADISFVPEEHIVGILPEPTLVTKGERLYYTFPKAVDVFEKP